MGKTFRFLVAILMAASAEANFAEDYLGAREALKQMAAQVGTGKGPVNQKDTRARLAEDLEAYRVALPSLDAKEGASQWLDLVTRLNRLNADVYNRGDDFSERVDFSSLVKVLPPPEAWRHMPALLSEKKADGKPEAFHLAATKWFVSYLLNDEKALLEEYRSLVKMAGEGRSDMGSIRLQMFDELDQQMFFVLKDEAVILELLNQRLEAARQQPVRRGENQEFFLPNLVALLGEEKASEFLVKVMTTLPMEVSIRQGRKTRDLAAELALKNVDSLKAAQWGLAEDLENGELYAALLKKFGPESENHAYQNARTAEFARLLIAGKIEAAAGLVKDFSDAGYVSLPSGFAVAAENSGHLREIAGFFHDQLAQNPNLPFWSDYLSLTLADGDSRKMSDLLQKALNSKDLDTEVRSALESHYVSTLLATDHLEEGIRELKKAAEAALKEDSGSEGPGYRAMDSGAIKIARIGLLVGRKDWIEEGVRLSRALLQKMGRSPETQTYYSNFASAFAKLLLDLGRGAEAEKVLIEALAVSERLRSGEAQRYPYVDPSESTQLLCDLTGVYAAANRYPDVLVLLDQASMWNVENLAQINDMGCYLGGEHSSPLGVCAARALLQAGRKDEARKVLLALLETDGGDDRVYEALINLDGVAVLPVLDGTLAKDPFEERPLIWKARVLLEEGKAQEAEAVAREAIKVDPSDGEKGAGDRMRVYAVLAETLAAQGDTKQADFFRGVVSAIRKSEKADRFYEQGLYTRAVALYKESLNDFADAYCIQSRLALRLSQQGDWKAAEEYYRRAYELMPDSFGRVESHCFGCEGAFNGTRQESLAERIFTEMASRPPVKPQVYYLLGYLRAEHGRYREALEPLEKAVALDPDYLNAWSKLSSLGEEIRLPGETRDRIAANIMRLDPYGRHARLDLQGVTDLATVWKSLEKIPPAVIISDLYPLMASARALEVMKQTPGQEQLYRQLQARRSSRNEVSAGQVFSEQGFTQAIERITQYSGMLFMR